MSIPVHPEVGQLVRVRGQQWVVSDVSSAVLLIDELSPATLPGRTLTTLTSVSEDDLGEELSIVWEVEPGRAVIPSGALPDVPEPDRWDDPQMLGAFIDAVRWGTVASADVTMLQAPFRAGIQIKDYQLERTLRIMGNGTELASVSVNHGVAEKIESWFRVHPDFHTAAPAQPMSARASQPGRTLIVDELIKLAQLRDAGVLTDEEFSQQKAKLLD